MLVLHPQLKSDNNWGQYINEECKGPRLLADFPSGLIDFVLRAFGTESVWLPYIDTQVLSDDMELISSGKSWQISTPNIGSDVDSDFFSRSHTYHAVINWPLDSLSTVEHGTLSINIEVPTVDDLIGRGEFWTGSKAGLEYNGTKKFWQEAQKILYCKCSPSISNMDIWQWEIKRFSRESKCSGPVHMGGNGWCCGGVDLASYLGLVQWWSHRVDILESRRAKWYSWEVCHYGPN